MDRHRETRRISAKRQRSLTRVREALWARLQAETAPNRRVAAAAAHLQYAVKRVDADTATQAADAAVSYLVDAAEQLLTAREKGTLQ